MGTLFITIGKKMLNYIYFYNITFTVKLGDLQSASESFERSIIRYSQETERWTGRGSYQKSHGGGEQPDSAGGERRGRKRRRRQRIREVRQRQEGGHQSSIR